MDACIHWWLGEPLGFSVYSTESRAHTIPTRKGIPTPAYLKLTSFTVTYMYS